MSTLDINRPTTSAVATTGDVERQLRAALSRSDDERQALEIQLQHGQKLESLGVLAGGIAHDFNNLLVAILGNAGMAMMEMPPGSPLLPRLEEIQHAAQRAAELVNQMLAYSGKGRFVLRACNLTEIAGEVAGLLRTAIGGVDVELRAVAELPAVDADPSQMRQVVMNLMTNAADAIPGGAGRIVLTTGTMDADAAYLAEAEVGRDAVPGRFVFVEVKDSGCGMDRATRSRIFDPFFTTKFAGRGLGLAAVLGIVRRHRGAIAIDTEPGQGTTFRVLFPASHAAAAPPAAPTTSQQSGGSRVLIVDDEPSVLRVASEMLKRAGFTVESAGGGEDAVALAGQPNAAFDVVLLDMTMPKMNGAETFKRLQVLQPGLPVVLMSGFSSEEAVSRFGLEGLSGFVQKPFTPVGLIKTITEALRTGAARGLA
jgi:signal transduction histidine kinase/ActR/RegA family two-component response regulator